MLDQHLLDQHLLDHHLTPNQFTATGTATASGATIRAIPTETAAHFLTRFDQAIAGTPEITLGAFEEGHTLIGAVALARRSEDKADAVLFVDPARRNLKIGSELLHAAVIEAGVAGFRRVVCAYSGDAVAADRLLRSSPFLVARRRREGRVTAILFAPVQP